MSYKSISHVIYGDRFFIYRIHLVTYRQRFFCLRNRDLPYILTIYYNTSKKDGDVCYNGTGLLRRSLDEITPHNFLFPNGDECFTIKEEIRKKRLLVDKLLDKNSRIAERFA